MFTSPPPHTHILTPHNHMSFAQSLDISPWHAAEIEGLVTAAWLCPKVIVLDDWIDEISGDNGRPAPIVPGIDDGTLGLIAISTFNKVTQDLRNNIDRYAPVFVDQEKRHCMWLFWGNGFARATRIHPKRFALFKKAPETRDAWEGMTRFMEAATEQLSFEEMEKCVDDAYLHAGDWVRSLLAWSQNYRQKPTRTRDRKGSRAA